MESEVFLVQYSYLFQGLVFCVAQSHSTFSTPDAQHTHTTVEEALFRDKKRGEGGSCLWRGSDVLICDPEANEQMLHYPPCASPGL